MTVTDFDPYTYTKGRWLDKDSERRVARHLNFDFQALLDVAVASSPGACHVVACEKEEGGFKRVFAIQLDNGRNVIARIPTRAVANAGLAVSSEVATLKFVKRETTVPVPAALSWSAAKDSPVGWEYIVMGAIPDVQLGKVWNDMSPEQHLDCIMSIADSTQQLCRYEFAAYGSLFMKDHCPNGSEPLQTEAPVVLGPNHTWLPDGVLSIEGNTTARSLQVYFTILSRLSITRQNGTSETTPVQTHTQHSRSTGSSMNYGTLLNTAFEVLKTLADLHRVKDAARPILFHPDLDPRNIFVDKADFTKVTGIIDWQSSTGSPAFIHGGELPDFAEKIELDEDVDAAAIREVEADTDEKSPRT